MSDLVLLFLSALNFFFIMNFGFSDFVFASLDLFLPSFDFVSCDFFFCCDFSANFGFLLFFLFNLLQKLVELLLQFLIFSVAIVDDSLFLRNLDFQSFIVLSFDQLLELCSLFYCNCGFFKPKSIGVEFWIEFFRCHCLISLRSLHDLFVNLSLSVLQIRDFLKSRVLGLKRLRNNLWENKFF